MDENFKKRMEDNGADVNTTVKRFMGKEELYMRFILKFQDDKNLQILQDNLAKKEYQEVFNNAHSIKGVSSNLGLNPIWEAAAAICDLLRGKQPEEVDTQKLQDMVKELEEVYQRFQGIIAEYAV